MRNGDRAMRWRVVGMRREAREYRLHRILRTARARAHHRPTTYSALCCRPTMLQLSRNIASQFRR